MCDGEAGPESASVVPGPGGASQDSISQSARALSISQTVDSHVSLQLYSLLTSQSYQSYQSVGERRTGRQDELPLWLRVLAGSAAASPQHPTDLPGR